MPEAVCYSVSTVGEVRSPVLGQFHPHTMVAECHEVTRRVMLADRASPAPLETPDQAKGHEPERNFRYVCGSETPDLSRTSALTGEAL